MTWQFKAWLNQKPVNPVNICEYFTCAHNKAHHQCHKVNQRYKFVYLNTDTQTQTAEKLLVFDTVGFSQFSKWLKVVFPLSHPLFVSPCQSRNTSHDIMWLNVSICEETDRRSFYNIDTNQWETVFHISFCIILKIKYSLLVCVSLNLVVNHFAPQQKHKWKWNAFEDPLHTVAEDRGWAVLFSFIVYIF